MDLKSKTIKGVKWSGIGQITANGLDFFVYVVLARILFPEDFGVFAMATVFTGFIATITQLGLENAIMQRKHIEENHLSTSFWVILTLGVFFNLLTVVLAPLAAPHFTNKLVQPVLRVFSLNFTLAALGFVHYTLLQRRVEFHKIAFIEVTTIALGGTASIVMALKNMGVWSLVYGWIIQTALRAMMSWIICNWRPKLLFDWQSFKELFGFSKNVVGWRVVTQLTNNIIHLYIGRMLGEATLGIYALAYKLSHIPTNKLSVIIAQVALPTFSSIQDDPAAIHWIYQKKLKYISLLIFPMLFGVIVTAPRFIEVVYAHKWAAAIVPLQILCWMSLIKSIIGHAGTILQAKNHPEVILRWSIVSSIIYLIALAVGLPYGLTGVCIALTIASFIAYFIYQYVTNELIQLSLKDFLATLYPATICSGIMSAGLFAYEHFYGYTFDKTNVLGFTILIVMGIIIYIGTLRFIFKNLYNEIMEMLLPSS